MSPLFNLTPRAAKEDLHYIWRDGVKKWGEQQADKYLSELFDRFAWLPENRPLWKHRPEIRDDYYSYLQGKHFIFFRQNLDNPECIDIIGIPYQGVNLIKYFYH